MGLGLSRSRHAETRQRRSASSSPPFNPRRSQRSDPTDYLETKPDFPIIPMPSYPLFNPMTGVPPVRYNNYFPSRPYFPSPQPMMMMMLPGGQMQPFGIPSASPNVAPTYMQPALPMVAPVSAPPSYPGRLLTDWTGGGKISPGFLGPPI